MRAAPAFDGDYAAALFDELRNQTSDLPGVTRAAFGPGEEFAHHMVKREAAALGLTQAVDHAGNLYITYEGTDPALPAWFLGSHLDSVPHGGNFDGAAGVLAALCVVRALKAADVRPRRSITVMAIRAEESNWFPLSYLGSRAAFGLLPAASLDVPRSDTGRSLREHMLELGLRPDLVAAGQAYLTPERVHGFLEVHIEQGPVLESADMPIGLVTGIAGSFRYRKARCVGAWGHSGAVPRAHRHDAVFALADLVVGMDAHWNDVLAQGQHATVTFGEVSTLATLHGFSTVPGEVGFSFDVRSQSTECLDELHAHFIALAESIEARRGVHFLLGERTGSTPALLDASLRAALARSARARGISFTELASGAGHDTAVFANAGIPAVMIFVRNQNGSHNPHEAMDFDDLGAAVEVLVHRLAQDS